MESQNQGQTLVLIFFIFQVKVIKTFHAPISTREIIKSGGGGADPHARFHRRLGLPSEGFAFQPLGHSVGTPGQESQREFHIGRPRRCIF